jgi:hydroxyacylglutathione hydrolase
MVTRISNSIFPSNTYLINSEHSNTCILIDPGLDQEEIDAKIGELNLVPRYIISTHGHFDHVASAAYFIKKYDAKFYIHEKELRLLKSVNFTLRVMKIERSVETPVPHHFLTGDSTVLALDHFVIAAYNFAGHTNGSCLLKWENNLFTGDTLYKNGLGLNSFPGEDKKKLKESLKEILGSFDDQLMVYPGHGDSAQLGIIRQKNIELETFVKDSIV